MTMTARASRHACAASDGRDEHCEAAYIAGCDGAHSVVRQTMGIGYPGATYRQVFYVADVEASGPAIDGELHADLDEADFLAVFPLAGKGRARLIGTVRDERADRADTLKFEDVSSRIIDNLKVRIEKVNWFSTYHVHHRVADHFRNGRAFLLGDAAHIHSPAGGQGMNTGIGDAINLAWKLKAVLAGGAPDKLLDSYEVERIAFARRLVKTTDRVFSLATAEGRLADIIRMRIVPLVIPAVAKLDAWREWLFRTVSQVMLNYRRGPLSEGQAGDVQGGDRLPWVAVEGADNYAPAGGDDLADPCLWHRVSAVDGMVPGTRYVAACFRLASAAWRGRPRPRRALSAAAGYLCRPCRQIGHSRCRAALFRRARNPP